MPEAKPRYAYGGGRRRLRTRLGGCKLEAEPQIVPIMAGAALVVHKLAVVSGWSYTASLCRLVIALNLNSVLFIFERRHLLATRTRSAILFITGSRALLSRFHFLLELLRPLSPNIYDYFTTTAKMTVGSVLVTG